MGSEPTFKLSKILRRNLTGQGKNDKDTIAIRVRALTLTMIYSSRESDSWKEMKIRSIYFIPRSSLLPIPYFHNTKSSIVQNL